MPVTEPPQSQAYYSIFTPLKFRYFILFSNFYTIYQAGPHSNESFGMQHPKDTSIKHHKKYERRYHKARNRNTVNLCVYNIFIQVYNIQRRRNIVTSKDIKNNKHSSVGQAQQHSPSSKIYFIYILIQLSVIFLFRTVQK